MEDLSSKVEEVVVECTEEVLAKTEEVVKKELKELETTAKTTALLTLKTVEDVVVKADAASFCLPLFSWFRRSSQSKLQSLAKPEVTPSTEST